MSFQTRKSIVRLQNTDTQCGAADTEQRTQFAFSGYSPKWRYADAEETNY